MRSKFGTVQQALPEKARGDWSQQMASRFVSTGKSQKDAHPQTTKTNTDAQVVERPIMGLKDALEQRKLEPLTPYSRGAWAEQLSNLGLWEKYPLLMQGLASGFNLGIPRIQHTYTPPNHPSIRSLLNVYSSIVDSEFAAGCYIGPFTCCQLESALGPFQTSPLSLVPKASKPGIYWAVHNFSHPHDASHGIPSINSCIDCDDFPCTWGTFATVALLIARLPYGAQASVHDVAEAYRMIPALPSQWPGLVMRLEADDQFAVNVCNNFGLTSAGGVYGMVADAGADIFWGRGMGPVAKWVDDHIFFRVPWVHLSSCNAQRAQWQQEIQSHGGRRREGSRLWYGGKCLPDGSTEEFDEDCSTRLRNYAGASPRSPDDQQFSYADTDIDELSSRLGIKWQTSKSVPFVAEVPYLGFRWDLHTRTVHLPEEKKAKYLAAIAEWGAKRTHNLLEMQKLYGKLLHAALVIPAGRAHLTNMEAMLASFSNNPFLPHTPPRDTPGDLRWWQLQLGRASVFIPVPRPRPLSDYRAYSDASSGFGVAVTIGPRWRAWRLAPGWKSQGRDIQWAEAIGFELLAIGLCAFSSEGEHIVVYGDNRGVVEGWWKRCSANRPTNHVFRRILQFSEDRNRTIHTKYVPSAQNPADAPSQGIYPPPPPAPSSSISNPGELARAAVVRHLVRGRGAEPSIPGVELQAPKRRKVPNAMLLPLPIPPATAPTDKGPAPYQQHLTPIPSCLRLHCLAKD
jgi:hypothetical protein